jgi:hypothetical protein
MTYKENNKTFTHSFLNQRNVFMTMTKKIMHVTTLLVVIFLNSCSHKDAGYTCVCDPRMPGTPGSLGPGLDTFYQYGNLPWSEAYAKCISHIDSLDTCVLVMTVLH